MSTRLLDDLELSACKRIRIIGATGSGKTRLAGELGAALGLQVTNLDNPLLPCPDADATWLVEGVQLWHAGATLDAADLIIWLDLPERLCRRRLISDRLRQAVDGSAEHKGRQRLGAYLREQHDYFSRPPREPSGPDDWAAITRAQTEAELERRGTKVLRLTSMRDVAALRARAGL